MTMILEREFKECVFRNTDDTYGQTCRIVANCNECDDHWPARPAWCPFDSIQEITVRMVANGTEAEEKESR